MNDYAEKIKDMNWSYSRMNSYYQCPYQFYLNYILKDFETYPSTNNFWGENGGLVHEILEKIFKGELDVEDASEYYAENFDDVVISPVKASTKNKKYELCADYLVNVDFDWLKDYEILGVEKEVNTLINGYKFKGYIDLLLRRKETGEIIVIDHKSSEYPLCADGKTVKKGKIHSHEGYKRQLYLYSNVIKEEYGEYPTELWWNYFADEKHRYVKIPFKLEEMQAAIDWFTEGVETILNDELFNSNYEYFFCVNLCNFKTSCEFVLDHKSEFAAKYKRK